MRNSLLSILLFLVVSQVMAQTPAPAPAAAAPLANQITEYKAQVVSTNFTVPIIRFNPIDKDSQNAPTNRKGNVSFFNSIGAGVGYYWGRLSEVTDKDAKVISTEMDNIFGFQSGFLFASNSSNGNNANIFAWTIGVSILNFQIGYGYEFGTIGENEKRGFLTIAYGVPVAKLLRGGFYKVKGDAVGGTKGQNKLTPGFVR